MTALVHGLFCQPVYALSSSFAKKFFLNLMNALIGLEVFGYASRLFICTLGDESAMVDEVLRKKSARGGT